MRSSLKLVAVFAVVLCASGTSAQEQRETQTKWAEAPAMELADLLPPLPRYREGGTPYDPTQERHARSIRTRGVRPAHSAGLIASPPEYAPVRGVLFRWIRTQWSEVVRDCVVALTADPAHDDIAYVVVAGEAQRTMATRQFASAGADMSKVEFIIEPSDSVWMRDYGPHFISLEGAFGIVDSHYYPGRPGDNFIPTLLGDDHFLLPTYDMGLYYSGGNFLPGPGRSAFVSSLINLDNPASDGFTEEFIAELYSQYQGIDTLHILPQLPPSVDGTGHIDMWLYLVDEDTVIISEFAQGSDPMAIEITDNAVPYMESLGFEVFRPKAWNVERVHYTYTNAFRVNARIFIPTYGEGDPSYLPDDADALAVWAAAAGPQVEIVPINCYDIIPAAGAIHCIVMQVPRYTAPVPSLYLISPTSGELLVSGTTYDITWTATDTDNVVIPDVDLYFSTDDGATFEFIATTPDSGGYAWAVPNVVTERSRIKIVARAADLDDGEAISAWPFQIAPAVQTVYGFGTGGGVDKFAWGSRTMSWSRVSGTFDPVDTDISTLDADAFDKLALSDATEGDSDSNRYESAIVGGRAESTHVFEFAIGEDPAEIDDLEISWEGYAGSCTQAELYVWDHVASDWGDGAGLHGQNRFMDNWAGNRDGILGAHVRAELGRYIDATGYLTLLLYAERVGDKTFHDHVAVTVSRIETIRRTGDFDDDGDTDLDDFRFMCECLAGPDATSPPDACLAEWFDLTDLELDGDADLRDFANFQVGFTGQ